MVIHFIENNMHFETSISLALLCLNQNFINFLWKTEFTKQTKILSEYYIKISRQIY